MTPDTRFNSPVFTITHQLSENFYIHQIVRRIIL